MKRKKESSKKNNAQLELIKKMQRSGKKIVVDPEGMEKMSVVIEEFAIPLLVDCKSDQDVKNAILCAILVWNLTFFSEDEQKDKIMDIIKMLSLPNNPDVLNGIKRDIDDLITRKRKLFSHVKRVVMDYKFSGAGSTLRLDIASSVHK